MEVERQYERERVRNEKKKQFCHPIDSDIVKSRHVFRLHARAGLPLLADIASSNEGSHKTGQDDACSSSDSLVSSCRIVGE